MNNPFVKLSIDRLNDCTFVDEMNRKLAEAEQSLHDYLAKHGDAVKKAKADVKVKVTLSYDRQSGWGIVTEPMEVVKPKDPPKSTVTFRGRNAEGQPVLFVQRSGSTTSHPQQSRLCTDSGARIDPETGEITKEASAAA